MTNIIIFLLNNFLNIMIKIIFNDVYNNLEIVQAHLLTNLSVKSSKNLFFLYFHV